MKESKIVLFGGNGFVGTAVAQELIHQGFTPVCVSRTGSMPMYLNETEWAEEAEWIQGDALNPDPQLFDKTLAVVTLVGSPPVPTFSKLAYQKQLTMNSEPNLAVMRATAESEVKRLVILGAHLPEIVQTDKFGYAKGKRLCEEAAQQFADESDQHTAVVVKPTAIYGVRHSATGRRINIGLAMKPIANLQAMLPKKYLPETLVSVQAVANSVVNACLDQSLAGRFSVVTNQQIIEQDE